MCTFSFHLVFTFKSILQCQNILLFVCCRHTCASLLEVVPVAFIVIWYPGRWKTTSFHWPPSSPVSLIFSAYPSSLSHLSFFQHPATKAPAVGLTSFWTFLWLLLMQNQSWLDAPDPNRNIHLFGGILAVIRLLWNSTLMMFICKNKWMYK